MTNSALQNMDRLFHRAFKRLGGADDGLYTAPYVGAIAVSARLFVDRNAEFFGDQQPGVFYRTEVRILKQDVAAVKPGGTLQILDSTGTVVETYKIKTKIGEDESLSRWVVEPWTP